MVAFSDQSLFDAVKAGDAEQVRDLLKGGANVRAKDRYKETPLIYAAQNDSLEIIKLLIEHNALVDFPGERGWTPLRYAVDKGKIENVRLLIAAGANVNSHDRMRETPLYWAIFRWQLEVARLLIENGAQIDIETRANATCLTSAVSGPPGIAMDYVKLLIESGANLEFKANEVFVDAVLSAHSYGGTEVLEYLLDHGLRFFTTYPSGQSVIEVISRQNGKGTKETVAFLNSRAAKLGLT